MDNLTENFTNILLSFGADRCGFGDISELPPESRERLPVGVCVAVFVPAGIIKGIAELPIYDYFDFYTRANELLDSIAIRGAEYLTAAGYAAIAQTRARAGSGETSPETLLPHKTVTTRVGIGWIGKCALLVTEERGSMLRLSSILTDAPLETANTPIDKSRCGNCNACRDACPGGAVSGMLWEKAIPREEFFNAEKCRDTARERSKRGFGGNATICGKCIEVCPYSRRLFSAE
jgi:epoxyqueuosine reductase QueG